MLKSWNLADLVKLRLVNRRMKTMVEKVLLGKNSCQYNVGLDPCYNFDFYRDRTEAKRFMKHFSGWSASPFVIPVMSMNLCMEDTTALLSAHGRHIRQIRLTVFCEESTTVFLEQLANLFSYLENVEILSLTVCSLVGELSNTTRHAFPPCPRLKTLLLEVQECNRIGIADLVCSQLLNKYGPQLTAFRTHVDSFDKGFASLDSWNRLKNVTKVSIYQATLSRRDGWEMVLKTLSQVEWTSLQDLTLAFPQGGLMETPKPFKLLMDVAYNFRNSLEILTLGEVTTMDLLGQRDGHGFRLSPLKDVDENDENAVAFALSEYEYDQVCENVTEVHVMHSKDFVKKGWGIVRKMFPNARYLLKKYREWRALVC